MPCLPLLFFLFARIVLAGDNSLTFSAPLLHRFSEEARAAATAAPAREVGRWPSRRSREYYEVLVRSDLLRRRRRLGGAKYSNMYPAEGSETLSLGNDFGWLYYTWVDIGTPNVSFLVALDAGSDLFWVPCDCIQCAPLSGYHGSSDKELGMYTPDESKTSKHLSCSHELCTLGASCRSAKQPCPYRVNYYSENTSTSGLLVEDILYLASSDDGRSVQAPVILGCGRKQSGGYLDGIAPDGLLGLGFGEISVPSMLAGAGLVRNSFSVCFRSDESGRLLFGDQGVLTQDTTPFVALDGKYFTYIVGVENFCIGTQCPDKTNFQAIVDSGSSFTFLPDEVYHRVMLEQINASRFDYEGSPWEYCYNANSLEVPEVPAVILTFSVNKSFEAVNPIFPIHDKEDKLVGFCLALQSSAESLGTIGREYLILTIFSFSFETRMCPLTVCSELAINHAENFMTGYDMVFDRENLKLGWSRSDCRNLGSSTRVPLTPSPQSRPENPLPTNQQQSSPTGRAVPPAVAGRAPVNPSAASPQGVTLCWSMFLILSQFFLNLIGL
ncbi:Aspartic proteinase-like protein 1 [Apostasia shenzhenica]|uniref:Aspartic proteinase-like protein 1 n=1 Tax=Apostasia shenzhenica TaxID=1088818 RepID=A0A2I0ARA6_9ASPA|nr:Aspartic proteinase-like protein 1 [Apostasia shenzhenica]